MRIHLHWRPMPSAARVVAHAKEHPVRKDDPKSGGLWLVRNPTKGSMITSCEINALPEGGLGVRLHDGQWCMLMTSTQVCTPVTSEGAPLDFSMEA